MVILEIGPSNSISLNTNTILYFIEIMRDIFDDQSFFFFYLQKSCEIQSLQEIWHLATEKIRRYKSKTVGIGRKTYTHGHSVPSTLIHLYPWKFAVAIGYSYGIFNCCRKSQSYTHGQWNLIKLLLPTAFFRWYMFGNVFV
jgi:hypothetical protein